MDKCDAKRCKADADTSLEWDDERYSLCFKHNEKVSDMPGSIRDNVRKICGGRYNGKEDSEKVCETQKEPDFKKRL